MTYWIAAVETQREGIKKITFVFTVSVRRTLEKACVPYIFIDVKNKFHVISVPCNRNPKF